MGEIHHYHHQPEHQPQPEPVFEQLQQQKLMTEQSVENFSFFNYFNIQCSNNNNNNSNYNYHQHQQQQTLQQFQNLPTNHRGSFPSLQHFHPQQCVKQQQRGLQRENNHYHHHYQQPSCSRDNNNYNNFGGFITGGGSSGGIPIPSIPSDLNGSCRNDNDVTASHFTSMVRPSHFWRLNTDICEDRRNKSGDDYINEANDNGKDREYHNQNQNFGYDDHDGQEVSSRRYLSELEEVFCGNTSTSSQQPPSLDEFVINHLNAKKAGKQVVKEVPEQEMQSSPSMVADHDRDHDTKKKKRSRERDEELIKLIQTLVKQFLNQQEVLFMKFMEKIEKMDKERKEREESWRRREIENLQLHFSVFPKSHIGNGALQTMPPPITTTATTTAAAGDSGSGGSSSSKRWPDEEVNALIHERMKLAERFQEPGLKWPLWKEISNRMCSLGYHRRDAKRCKEKWDNINKCFRKYREQMQDGRRQKLRTCVYFNKLDQLYNSNSNSIINGGCYGGGGDVDLQEIHGEEISVKKTDGRLVEEEEEVEVEWDELDLRF